MASLLAGPMRTASAGLFVCLYHGSGKSKSNYQGGNKQDIPNGFHDYLQG